MACGATLKRSLEFDPVHSPGRSPKRLCVPKDLMSPSTLAKQQAISACEASQKFNNQFMARYSAMSPPHSPASNDFTQQAHCTMAVSGLQSSVLKSPVNLSVRPSASSSNQIAAKEQPLFTLSQVDMICRRFVQEHEENVREQFDKVLSHKLSEQYESFLKFNHDQLKRRFENPYSDCSYVS